MSLTKSIAAWAAGVTWQDVPTRVQEHARNDLRDVLSVMFAGTLTTSARIAAQYARASPGLIKTGPDANGPYSVKWPSSSVALCASKHNPFLNFTGTQDALANMVPDTQLATDLATGKLPNFSLVVPDQCHDMHGTGPCEDTTALIAAGDTYVGNTVRAIMASKTRRRAATPSWSPGMRTTSPIRASPGPAAAAPTPVAAT